MTTSHLLPAARLVQAPSPLMWITWMVSRLVSPLLPSTPTVSPEVVIYPHEGQIMSLLCSKLPRCFHLSKGRSPNRRNRVPHDPSLLPTLPSTKPSLSHVTICPFLCSPLSNQLNPLTRLLYTPSLSYLLPRCCSFLCSYPRCSHDPPFPFLQNFALNSLTQLGLSFCTSLSSQNCSCPSMTLCPFPQAIFPHNTHPFYSIEVIWLLGLFLQSVMSTFEYKLYENGDFCLYCSLSLEKYLRNIVDAQ